MNSSRKARWLTIFLVAGIVLLGAVSAWAQITEVWVDDDYTTATPGWGVTHFEKIQDGVNGVADDGTVHVANGNYNAASSPFVRITKPLTLIGESRDGVILDGTGTSTIAWAKGIHVTANDVSMKNLTVQNFGAPSYWGYGVLFRDYAHDTPGEGFIYYTGCVAENVKSQNNCYPMYAFCNQNLTVHNCLIQNNLSDGMFIAKGSSGATITDNTVLNSGDHGIWVGGAGWCGPSCPDATITGNTINGAREGGISFVSSDGATISNNTITNVAGEGYSKGALSLRDGCSNVEAYNNTIYNNNGSWGGYNGTGNAIGIDGIPLNINLHDNTIYGNTGYGCYNASSVVIDASSNWWGTTDPTVVAGLVSSLVVDFTPMLNSGVDGDPVTPGWQPDLSSLTVHTLGQQVGTTGRIQEGINLVTSSTVNVAAGTYQESLENWKDLEVTKTLDLVGAGSDSTLVQLSENNFNGVEIYGTNLAVLLEGLAFTRRPGNTYASDFNLRIAETLGGPSSFTNLTLRDVEVAYAYAQGVSLGSTGTFDVVLIDNCYIHDNYYGLYSRGTVNEMTIQDSLFENNRRTSIILGGNHRNVTLDNVEVANAGNYSLSLGGIVGSVRLEDCHFHNGGSYLLYLNADIPELTVVNSQLDTTAHDVGVDFEQGTSYGIVIFSGTEIANAASANVRIKSNVSIDELTFENCNVHDAGNSGVLLWGQADKTTIANSHFDNNAKSGFDFGHFGAGGAGKDISVEGSTFNNNINEGIGMANSQNATFTDVVASDNGGAGFMVWEWVDSSTQLAFEGSTFGRNGWDGLVFVTQDGKAIDNVVVKKCVIADNTVNGVEFWRFDGGTISNVAVNLCAITGNGGGIAVVNPDGTLNVDAVLNWWGDAAGPSGEGAGAGDGVSEHVIFSPWLGTGPDGNPAAPGVQITGPMLIIVAPVGPEPVDGYLNAAIAGANSPDLPHADTIQVQHGTYDASTPITEAVNIVSETGSALHTTLNGNMSINGNGVLVGLPLQGFRMNGNVTVGAGANAASSSINWCDLYGSMTNNGTGTFDAQYNYWGTLLESIVDGRTTGLIDYEPFLPKNADDSYVDATAIIAAGLAAGIDPAIDQLWLMVQLGQDVSTFIGYAGVAGAGAFAGAPAGASINLGGAAGGGGAVEGAISGTYTLGEPIDGRFTLTDPVTGEPITDAAVTTSLLGPDGALVFWGCAIYDETTGEYVFTIDTSGLAPGTYELIIQTDDGQSKTVSIEVLAA